MQSFTAYLATITCTKAMKEVVQAWLKGFPDIHVDNDIIISENDLVSIQWRVKGTHKRQVGRLHLHYTYLLRAFSASS